MQLQELRLLRPLLVPGSLQAGKACQWRLNFQNPRGSREEVMLAKRNILDMGRTVRLMRI